MLIIFEEFGQNSKHVLSKGMLFPIPNSQQQLASTPTTLSAYRPRQVLLLDAGTSNGAS